MIRLFSLPSRQQPESNPHSRTRNNRCRPFRRPPTNRLQIFLFTATGRPLSKRQLHFHSGRAVQRSVNQRNIFTIISHWSVGGREAGHFHRHKTFTSIWTRPVCWTTRMELIRRQFYLPPGDTKEDEPTSFFRNLACSWATAGRVGRSYASHSLMAMVTKDHWSYSQTTLCSSTNPTGIESQVPNYGNYVRALNVWALIVLLTIRPTSWTTKNKREAQGIEGQWC